MGRKRLPTALKIVKGTQRKCRLNPDEPAPGADNLAPPDYISREALKHWPIIVTMLKDAGVASDMDAMALCALCEAVTTWVQATTEVRKHGLITEGKYGPCANPSIKISNDASDRMMRILIEFGMTPSARSKVSGKKKKEVNEFSDF